MKKYFFPLVLLAVFEAVAVVLWLTRDNLFYLFNFSYIGVSVSLGVFLFVKKYRHARRIVQLSGGAVYASVSGADLRREYADRGVLVLSVYRGV